MQSDVDITKHKLVEHDALRAASAHMYALQHFRDHVVNPSINSISTKVDELLNGMDDYAVFMLSDFIDLRNTSIQAFTLAVQAMWERGVREILSALDSSKFNGSELSAIRTAKWSDSEKKGSLQFYFKQLVGISMRSFTSYTELNVLFVLANGIRHGDGFSVDRLYELCPSLWPNAVNQKLTPSFTEINIPLSALEQMIKSVHWFWDDIENIRCNSFERKAPIVEQKLSNWRLGIDQRDAERVWVPV